MGDEQGDSRGVGDRPEQRSAARGGRFADAGPDGIAKERPCGANHGGKSTEARAPLRSEVIRLTSQTDPPDRRSGRAGRGRCRGERHTALEAKMRERSEVIANVVLIAAAVRVSAVAVRLVFFPAVPLVVGGDPGPPDSLDESMWNALLGAGVLLDGTASSPPVTVVAFMDLDCSACRQSHSAFMDVKNEFGDSVAHLLVHFSVGKPPLRHPRSPCGEVRAGKGQVCRLRGFDL